MDTTSTPSSMLRSPTKTHGGWLTRLLADWSRPGISDDERFVAASADLADIERRLRRLDHGDWRPLGGQWRPQAKL